MDKRAYNFLALALIGVANAAYLDGVQAPAGTQLSFDTSFSRETHSTSPARSGYYDNRGNSGGFPTSGATRGTLGGISSGASSSIISGGGLTASGSATGEAVLPGRIGSGFGVGLHLLESGGSEAINDLGNAIGGGGVPGENYPILDSVPSTKFSCDGLLPGYYADTDKEARCQVFHVCQSRGRINSFLCPNGTIFNQQYFVCDWWYNVDCSTAQQFYSLNAQIGQVAIGGDRFGTASSLQESVSSFGNGGPPTSYQAQEGSNINIVDSRINQNNALVNDGGNAFNGDRRGSASNQQDSFSALTVGKINGSASSSHHGTTNVARSNFGASTNPEVLRRGNTGTTSESRKEGLTGSNTEAVSDRFDSASAQLGSVSPSTITAFNGGAPSAYYETPNNFNGNFGASSKQEVVLTQKDTTGTANEDRSVGFTGSYTNTPSQRSGSASVQQSSFSPVTGYSINGDAPPTSYENPSSVNGNFGASSKQEAVVRGATGTTNVDRKHGFTGSNTQASSDRSRSGLPSGSLSLPPMLML
nr:uncharacterized protein LOC128695880 [Cherax quadricarinatus]